MQFEFNHQLLPQDFIEIEQIGEFGLEATNDLGYCWYMIIKTFLGTSVICTCGPIIPDISIIPSGFTTHLDKIPYKEDKLAKTINYFLNDSKKGITSAKIISFDDAIDQFRELKDYLKNFSEDTF